MSGNNELLELKKQLEKAVAHEDITRACEITEKLKSLPMSIKRLQDTGIGRSVGKLRKHSNSQLAERSKTLVQQWKTLLPNETSSSSTPNKKKTSSLSNTPPKSTSTSTSTSTKTPTQKQINSQENGDLLANSNSSSFNQKKRNSLEMVDTKTNTKKPRNNTNSTNEENEGSIVSEKQTKKSPESNRNLPTTRGITQEKQLRTSAESIGTGGDQRARAREKFISALSSSSSGDLDPISVGTEIETTLYTMYDNGKSPDYLPKLRTLLFNLKDPKNTELRESVLSGHISPRQLCQMSSQEMASSDLKEWRKKTEEWFTKAAQVNGGEEEATCDSFKCSKCGSRKTKYNEFQTRSADEPMTVFITCCVCGKRWRS